MLSREELIEKMAQAIRCMPARDTNHLHYAHEYLYDSHRIAEAALDILLSSLPGEPNTPFIVNKDTKEVTEINRYEWAYKQLLGMKNDKSN